MKLRTSEVNSTQAGVGGWRRVVSVWMTVVVAVVTVLVWPADAWAQRSTPTQVLHPSGAATDGFGQSVAISGDTMVVGAGVDTVGANGGQGSAHVYRWSGTGWAFEATLTASDGAAGDNFGGSVAIFGDTVVVGAYLDDVGTNGNQGSAYVFVRSGTSWTQQAKLTAADGAASDFFGFAVAVSSDTVVVGAYLGNVGSNADQGAAYVFTRSGTAWAQQAKLIAADGAVNDSFGTAVSISGNTAVIGASGVDVGSSTNRGAAYVFVRSGTNWSQQAKLAASDAATGDSLGVSVAVSGDTAVVGAFFDDVGANANQGSAYVFVRSGTTWTQQAKLTASDGAANDSLGGSIALAGDTAVIGAYYDDVGANVDQGSAYVFVRSGTIWTQQSKLISPDGAASDRFGDSVAVFGNTAAAGAVYDDVGGNSNQGSVWVFSRVGGVWIEPDSMIVASDGVANDFYGQRAAIDGTTMIIGAPYDDVGGNIDQGSVYVYIRSDDGWVEQAHWTVPGGQANDLFGASVAISGETAVVGYSYDDGGTTGGHKGSVYVYVRSGSSWTQQAILEASDGLAGDYLGAAVAISGDTIVAGATGDDTHPTPYGHGSAYVFVRSGATWMQQAKLLASDPADSEVFGAAIALEGDTVVIGCPGEDLNGKIDQGAAYVFVRSASTWTRQARLTTSDGVAGDRFPAAMAMSGETVIASVSGRDIGGNVDQGAAYAFVRSGSTWSQQAILTASDGAAGDNFGYAVSLDGEQLVIGAVNSAVGGTTDVKGAYVFSRAGTRWIEQARIAAAGSVAGDQFGMSVALHNGRAVIGARLHDVGGVTNVGAAYTFSIPTESLSLAHNDTLDIAYPTLAAAFAAAQSGNQITATPAAFAADNILLDTHLRTLQLHSTGPVRIPYTSGLILDQNSSLAAAAGTPVEVYGLLDANLSGTINTSGTNLLLWSQARLLGDSSTIVLSGGNFDCAIDSNTQFFMDSVHLRMAGPDQTFEVMSTDLGGQSLIAMDRNTPGNYPLQMLEIGPAPATLRLVDNYDNDRLGQAACEALYVDTLQIDPGCRLINTDCRIYYHTLVKGGTVDVPANLVPICPADFNDSRNVSVQDIFDFLAAYFAGCTGPGPAPCYASADFNGSGTISVQDIFDFLAAYFAGCS